MQYPNVAIVKLSDLGNRMDAPFHILRTQHEADTKALEERMTKEDAKAKAITMFRNAPTQFRKTINPLIRTGSNRSPSLEEYEKAINEYPYLTITILKKNREDIEQHYRKQAAEMTAMAEYYAKPQGETE